MSKTKWLAGMALVLMLLISLIVGAGALAQEERSVELRLTPSRDSGVSGTAILTDTEDGTRVTLNMEGLPEEGVEHINHIHGGGTCTDDRAGNTAPVTIPLNTVVAEADGTGSATTTIDATLDKLFDDSEERYILLHAKAEKGEGVPPGIACADLVRPAIEEGELPESGGVQPATILLWLGVLLLALSVTARLVLWRNRQARS